MGLTEIMTVVQTISIVLGIVVAISALKGRSDVKTAEVTEMRTDIKYIKDTVADMKNLPTQVRLVEASASSAHKRLDEHLATHKRDGQA